MARVVSEVRPPFVFVENSPMLTTRGGTRVIADLTQMGYDTKWTVMGAADIGAPHQRDRMWIVGKTTNSTVNRLQRQANERILESQRRSELQLGKSRDTKEVAYSSSLRSKAGLADTQGWQEGNSNESQYSSADLANSEDKGDVWREWELGFTQQEYNSRGSPIDGSREWWSVEPNVGRVAHGVAVRVDRLKAIGNGQVPLCAATAWRILK
jgi:DNA (cytosine-5)-methyltransferase 1